MTTSKICITGFMIFALSVPAFALPSKPERARDLGIIIGPHSTGSLNAITDVQGVRVGHATLVQGEGKLVPGKGPVRTGVTVIVPSKDDIWTAKLSAGSFVLNGNGEATGLMWIQESGILETPIAFTNTLAVGTVQKALVDWMLSTRPRIGVNDDTLTPVVLECDDGEVNDIRGQHVTSKHVLEALKRAAPGPVAEGAVGAGTGMMTYEFKGGIGTSSRQVKVDKQTYTVGVILNANHGRRHTLRIKGVAVGEKLTDLKPRQPQDGSIVVVIATDAPLDARQLSRLSKRAMLGVGRTGAVGTHGSGDVAIAFSTANKIPHHPQKPVVAMNVLSDFWIDGLFEAAADAAEEAVINALLAGETMTGRDGNTIYGLPKDKLKALLH